MNQYAEFVWSTIVFGKAVTSTYLLLVAVKGYGQLSYCRHDGGSVELAGPICLGSDSILSIVRST